MLRVRVSHYYIIHGNNVIRRAKSEYVTITRELAPN